MFIVQRSIFNCHLSKYPGVPQGVPSRLRIHAKPVRALSDWNFRDEMAVIGIDGIDLGVVSAGKPEHFAIGGDPAHVRASAAGQLPFLDDAFAPRTTVHGSLADVFGVGLLFRGRSGIGKSECVLDLVERGHRLVADDVVHITRRGHDVLIGRGHEVSRHYMEIRGVGLIDINALFGIRSVRQQKRIEVVVQLEDWDNTREYDRTGLDLQQTDLLDVPLPLVTVPLNPGKNLTVICEVVAMNHLLRYSGVDSANSFNERLIRRMREKGELQRYLEDDYE